MDIMIQRSGKLLEHLSRHNVFSINIIEGSMGIGEEAN